MVMCVSGAFLKSKPLGGGSIYATPPLFAEKNYGASWELLKPLYSLSASRREWSGDLGRFLTCLGGSDIAR